MTGVCKEIVDFLGCEVELYENETDKNKIQNRYFTLLEEGKRIGFIPLVVIVSDTLAEKIGFEYEVKHLEKTTEAVDKWRKECAAKIKDADISGFLSFNGHIEEEENVDAEEDLFADFETGMGGMDEFCTYMNGETPYDEILIAKIPVKNPWELAIWIPMGGFNDCPSPEQQAAMFHYWYEKYKAYPAVAGFDTWELAVDLPVHREEDAKKLALEMYGFCMDIVDQGMETCGALASVLMDSKVWYFWWD